jgi:hypothetical protein
MTLTRWTTWRWLKTKVGCRSSMLHIQPWKQNTPLALASDPISCRKVERSGHGVLAYHLLVKMHFKCLLKYHKIMKKLDVHINMGCTQNFMEKDIFCGMHKKDKQNYGERLF